MTNHSTPSIFRTEARAPVVSVVIPTCNRAQPVVQAIQSVLEQTFRDLEVIVVDDGSTDNTAEMVCAIADQRLRYVNRRNGGLTAARNTGIWHARGKYLAFLDDNDRYLPNKLEVQVLAMERSPEIGLASGGWQSINESGEPMEEVIPWLFRPDLNLHTWLYGCPVTPSAVILRREWLQQTGAFDPALCETDDWDLWLRLSAAGCPMVWVKEIVSQHRIRPHSPQKKSIRQKEDILKVLDKYYAQPDLPKLAYTERGPIYASAHLRGAAREYGEGLVDDACQDVEQAIRLDPALTENDGDRLYDLLVGWAGDPLVGDAVKYVETALDHLPAQAAGLRARRKKAVAWAARQMLFNEYGRKDWPAVRRNLWTVAYKSPGLLRDRGILSIFWEGLVGAEVMRWVRGIHAISRGAAPTVYKR